MYLKLAIRNAKRSVIDYLLYIATTIILLSIIFVSNYIFYMGKFAGKFSNCFFTVAYCADYDFFDGLHQ